MKLTARQRGWIVAGILGALALALLAPFVLNTDARHLSAYRDGSEDASRFHSALDATGTVNSLIASPYALRDIADPENTLLVLLGIERRYDAAERDAILTFLNDGGNVLLADEGGYGTDIAQAAGWAFGSERVLDTRNHLGDPRLVAADVRVGDTSHRVLFNEPTTLVALTSAAATPHEVLATTSAAEYPDGSYLDLDGDGTIDRSDRPGPFPLAVRAQVGQGTLFLISDTGPFMNAQMGVTEFGNDAFGRALVASLVQGEARVLIDEGRHAPPAPLALWDTTARTLARVTQGPAGGWLALVLAAGALLAWRLTRATQDWSHHEHHVGDLRPVAANVRPDTERMQRHARRRINEKYNIPMEQVQAMTDQELFAATGDKTLSDAAAGTGRTDPSLFYKAGSASRPAPASSSPEATE